MSVEAANAGSLHFLRLLALASNWVALWQPVQIDWTAGVVVVPTTVAAGMFGSVGTW